MVSIYNLHPTETNSVRFLTGCRHEYLSGLSLYIFIGKKKSDPLSNLLSDVGSFTFSIFIFLIYNKKRDYFPNSPTI